MRGWGGRGGAQEQCGRVAVINPQRTFGLGWGGGLLWIPGPLGGGGCSFFPPALALGGSHAPPALAAPLNQEKPMPPALQTCV